MIYIRESFENTQLKKASKATLCCFSDLACTFDIDRNQPPLLRKPKSLKSAFLYVLFIYNFGVFGGKTKENIDNHSIY